MRAWGGPEVACGSPTTALGHTSSLEGGAAADCPGPWLRAWVEFQVDARINKALRDIAEGELAAGGGGALRASAASDSDAQLEVLRTEHEQLLGLVSGLVGKMDNMSEVALAAESRAGQFGNVAQTLSTLELRFTEFRDEACARQHQASDKLAAALDVLASTQREVGDLAKAVDRLDLRLSERYSDTLSKVETEVRGKLGPAASAAAVGADVARLGSELRHELAGLLQGFERDLASLAESQSNLELRCERLGSGAGDAPRAGAGSAPGVEWVTKVELEHQLEGMRSALKGLDAGYLSSQLESLERRLQETLEGFDEHVDEWKTELQQEVGLQHKRMAAELRIEMRTALRSEGAAVAALDEQLWLSDQRLGQRIDELAQLVANSCDQQQSQPLRPPGAPPSAEEAAAADAAVSAEGSVQADTSLSSTLAQSTATFRASRSPSQASPTWPSPTEPGLSEGAYDDRHRGEEGSTGARGPLKASRRGAAAVADSPPSLLSADGDGQGRVLMEGRSHVGAGAAEARRGVTLSSEESELAESPVLAARRRILVAHEEQPSAGLARGGLRVDAGDDAADGQDPCFPLGSPVCTVVVSKETESAVDELNAIAARLGRGGQRGHASESERAPPLASASRANGSGRRRHSPFAGLGGGSQATGSGSP